MEIKYQSKDFLNPHSKDICWIAIDDKYNEVMSVADKKVNLGSYALENGTIYSRNEAFEKFTFIQSDLEIEIKNTELTKKESIIALGSNSKEWSNHLINSMHTR